MIDWRGFVVAVVRQLTEVKEEEEEEEEDIMPLIKKNINKYTRNKSTGCDVRIYPLKVVEGGSPPGQKPIFCRFMYKLKKY